MWNISIRQGLPARSRPTRQAYHTPGVGYFGVIDERLDIDLVSHAAEAMPDVQFVMLGPVVKIDPASLPRASNLH